MRILKLKIENLLTLFYIIVSLINIYKTNNDMLLTSIALHLIIVFIVYYGVKETRKAIIEDIKDGLLEDLNDNLLESLEPLTSLIELLKDAVYNIKKRSYTKQPKTTKLKDAF